MVTQEKERRPGSDIEKSDQYKAVVHTLMNTTTDLALIIDPDGIILEVSEATAVRVGKNPNQLIGTCIYDYFKPETVNFRKAYVQLVTRGRQMIHFEDSHDDMNFLVRINPVLNNNNQVEKLAIFIADTTQPKKDEMLLHRYSRILSTINDPIAYIDKEFRCQTVNEAMLKIYQKKKEEMIGRPMAEVVGQEVFKEKFKPYILECLESNRVYHQDWFDFPDGQRRFMYMSFYPLFVKDKVTGVVVNAIDVTKMKELEEQLKLLSQTDQLTQIFNRTKFDDSLTMEINRARRYKSDLSLIMFDIDHFKEINDTYGHDVGDKALVTLANRVAKCIRDTDIFARWGGEEFMILLPHTSLDDASILAERIRGRIEKDPFEKIGTVTSSFGVTQFVHPDTEETLTKRADRALYRAKQKGRNRVIAARAKEKE